MSVDFQTKEAVVTYDPSKTDPQSLVRYLSDQTGGRYTATVKS